MSESVKVGKFIDDKTIKAIAKKFLSNRIGDDEKMKWYKVTDCYDIEIDNEGSAVFIELAVKYKNTYNHVDKPGILYYNLKDECVEKIPEMYEFKDGKTKKRMPTGRYIELNDVKNMFESHDLSTFNHIVLTKDDIQTWIDLSAAMIDLYKLGTDNACSILRINQGKIQFMNYNNGQVKFQYVFENESIPNVTTKSFIYDSNLMNALLSSVKLLKIEKLNVFIADNRPIIMTAEDTNYKYNFGIQRLIVRKE